MKLFNLIICLSITSCAVQFKKAAKDPSSPATNLEPVSTIERDPIRIAQIQYDKPDNWANYYYKKTYFKVKNPIVVDSYKQLVKVCKSDDKPFLADYQLVEPSPVEYKVSPISIKSPAGFNEKVYLSRGACRELSLYKSPKIKRKDQFRRKIKSMTLIYVYNMATYIKDITFSTQYSDVEFYVE